MLFYNKTEHCTFSSTLTHLFSVYPATKARCDVHNNSFANLQYGWWAWSPTFQSLCGPGRTVSSLVVNSVIVTTKCGAAWQQTVGVIPKVHISRLCQSLRCARRRRRRQIRAGAPEILLWRIRGADPASVPVIRCLVLKRTLLFCSA